MKLCADANHLGISSETAWRRWQRGELPAHQVPSGTVMVEVPPLAQGARPQQVAVYARVSSAETRKHLDRQAERVVACCLARGWPVAGPWLARGWPVAKGGNECGSGSTDQRPQFLALLADTSSSHMVVEHTDRCPVLPLWGRLSPGRAQDAKPGTGHRQRSGRGTSRPDAAARRSGPHHVVLCAALWPPAGEPQEAPRTGGPGGGRIRTDTDGYGLLLMRLTRALTHSRLGEATHATLTA